MKIKVILGLLVSLLISINGTFYIVHAFSITSPANGSEVEAGTTLRVQVDPSGVGEIVGVLFTGSYRDIDSNFVVTPPFEWSVQIPRDRLGPLTITAVGKVLGQKTGPAPKASVTVNVKLPQNVTLQSIQHSPPIENLFLEPETERTQDLAISGLFSDGIKREITSSVLGTTYQSSDEKVVTVDKEGVITAVSVGKAIVTVKNGDKTGQIRVVVYPRP